MNYWFYDDTAAKFRIRFFSSNGPYTEEGNRYDGEVADCALTFTGPARFQYELDVSGRIRLNADGTVTVRWWLRDENGIFQRWMTNVCTAGVGPRLVRSAMLAGRTPRDEGRLTIHEEAYCRLVGF